MVPIVTQLASDFDGRALVGTVDASTQSTLTSAYGITSVPSFIFFKNGREVSRQVGTTTYGNLADKMQTLVTSP
jgi:thioredoxin-like negative regulator of GroEL